MSSINIYEFEGDNYKEQKRKDETAVDAERDLYFEQVKANRQRAVKKDVSQLVQIEKKAVKLNTFHLYADLPRLLELMNQENDYRYELQVKKAQDLQNLTMPPSESMAHVQDNALPNLTNSKGQVLIPLSEEQMAEKEALLSTGFPDWTKVEYYAYIRGCEKFGQKAYKDISVTIGTKSEAQVIAYGKAFWERGPNILEDWDKIKKNIDKAEETRKEDQEAAKMMKRAVGDAEYYFDVKFDAEIYNKFRSRMYLEEHDKYLAFQVAHLGMNSVPEIKEAIKHESAFEMDAYFRTRGEGDLHKRITQVVKFMKSQEEDLKNKEKTWLKAFKEVEKSTLRASDFRKPKKSNISKATEKNEKKKATPSRGSSKGPRSQSKSKVSF